MLDSTIDDMKWMVFLHWFMFCVTANLPNPRPVPVFVCRKGLHIPRQ